MSDAFGGVPSDARELGFNQDFDINKTLAGPIVATGETLEGRPIWRQRFSTQTPTSGNSKVLTTSGIYWRVFSVRGWCKSSDGRYFTPEFWTIDGSSNRLLLWADTSFNLVLFDNGTFFADNACTFVVEFIRKEMGAGLA